MTDQEARDYLYSLWENGEVPDNFNEDHSDYEKALLYTKDKGRFDYNEFYSDMVIIKFGIWQVEPDALVGKVGYDYVIGDTRFWETEEYNGDLVWSWLIHLTKKSWINKDNVKDLNTAFFFCQDYFRLNKPESLSYVSTAQTLNIQQQLLVVKDKLSENERIDKYKSRDIEDMIRYKEMLDGIKFL
ncbi:MAG: hypothetical protein BM557_08270 [Flavobacterium sp. MedPE-SWcel]|uniref:hypothetical protein n=1 Tax=uncultured Flavobacterium sp. TaxID=165435 RepID=UPI00091A7002|nr:hypothetical protein [uncultured Flavobacterium sp.]OIQ17673.1 MAG: hypothetical protein BM557_08270 [Flavobacterium sp. MedPE-SWcel]